jgi:hypothetical protein
MMNYVDYSHKISGLVPLFYPAGDLEAGMLTIKAFYTPFKGKNTANSFRSIKRVARPPTRLQTRALVMGG